MSSNTEVDTIDPRLLNLSYSSGLTLHACPRKYQLQKLQSDVTSTEDEVQSITFAFGHMVGTGLQSILSGKSRDEWVLEAFMNWPIDLFAEDEKRAKSFWHGLIALDRLDHMRNSSILRDYEVMMYEGAPACELSFCIHLPNRAKFRGHVDIVLQHRETGEILVTECKTTASYALTESQYKNSSQGIGYSVVLDRVVGKFSSYKVLYPVYKTKSMEWEFFVFDKHLAQRAGWLQSLLFDVSDIVKYNQASYFPTRGESCRAWNRDCHYFGICEMSIARLAKPLTDEDRFALENEHTKYKIQVTFEELLQEQLTRAGIEDESEPEETIESLALTTNKDGDLIL